MTSFVTLADKGSHIDWSLGAVVFFLACAWVAVLAGRYLYAAALHLGARALHHTRAARKDRP